MQIPLVGSIMALSDRGTPITAVQPGSAEAGEYVGVARGVIAALDPSSSSAAAAAAGGRQHSAPQSSAAAAGPTIRVTS